MAVYDTGRLKGTINRIITVADVKTALTEMLLLLEQMQKGDADPSLLQVNRPSPPAPLPKGEGSKSWKRVVGRVP